MTPEERREADCEKFRKDTARVIEHMGPVQREVFLAGIRFAFAKMREDSPGHRAGASQGKEDSTEIPTHN